MPLVSRIAQLMLPPAMQVDQDFSLEGWPWNESAQAWVEPTAFALLALRKAGSLVAVPGIAERIQAGEALVWDRMCDGGGWNYGNKRVFGEHLEPFADVTACALLGMHASHQAGKANPSLDRLEGLLRRQSSGLALSLGTLALAAYGRRTEEWIDRLIETYAETGFRAEARSLALSLIALRGEVKVLLS